MLIQILSVQNSEAINRQGKKYNVLDIAYKGEDGKVSGKKIMSFTFPDVFNTLKEATVNSSFTITANKNKNNFIEWTEAVPYEGDFTVTKETATSTNSGYARSTPKSTYETPEERYENRYRIMRQAAVNAAINLLKTEKVTPELPAVLLVAEEIFNFYRKPMVLIEAKPAE